MLAEGDSSPDSQLGSHPSVDHASSESSPGHADVRTNNLPAEPTAHQDHPSGAGRRRAGGESRRALLAEQIKSRARRRTFLRLILTYMLPLVLLLLVPALDMILLIAPNRAAELPAITVEVPEADADSGVYLDDIRVDIQPVGWSYMGSTQDWQLTIAVGYVSQIERYIIPSIEITMPEGVSHAEWLSDDEAARRVDEQVTRLQLADISRQEWSIQGRPESPMIGRVAHPFSRQIHFEPAKGRSGTPVYSLYSFRAQVHLPTTNTGLLSGTSGFRVLVSAKSENQQRVAALYNVSGEISAATGTFAMPRDYANINGQLIAGSFGVPREESFSFSAQELDRPVTYVVAILAASLLSLTRIKRLLLRSVGWLSLVAKNRAFSWQGAAQSSLAVTTLAMAAVSATSLIVAYSATDGVTDEGRIALIYAQPSQAGAWKGVDLHSVNMQMYPLAGRGPSALLPDVSGLELRMTAIALTNLKTKSISNRYGADLTPSRILVHLPVGHSNDALVTDSRLTQAAETLLLKRGVTGAFAAVIPPTDDMEWLSGDLATVPPAVLLPTYRRDRLMQSPETPAALIYSMQSETQRTFVRMDGLASATHALGWEPGLGRQWTPNDAELVFQACKCGLRAVSPPPSNSYSDTILWLRLDPRNNAIYEVSTDSWISSLVAFSNYAIIPAIVGWLVTFAFSTRRKKNTKKRA